MTGDSASRARTKAETGQGALWPTCERCHVNVVPGARCDGRRFHVRLCPFTGYDPATLEPLPVGGVLGPTSPATG